MNKAPIFIVGTGRSGTTLLLTILNKHSSIYSIRTETYFFEKKENKTISMIKEFEKKGDIVKLFVYILTLFFSGGSENATFIEERKILDIAIKHFHEIAEQYDISSIKTKEEVFDICANFLTLKENKKRWAEKTPFHIYSADKILARYPDAQFIEIYRDPRAVYYSWKNHQFDLFDKCHGIQLIDNWNASAHTGEKLCKKMPLQYYRLKYEGLVFSPEGELRKLCTFLNIEFEPQLLDTIVVNSPFKDVKEERGFSKIPTERWKNKLPSEEKVIVDILTKKFRIKYDYPDSGAKIRLNNFLPFTSLLTKAGKYYNNRFRKKLVSKLSSSLQQ